jgi:hypothetical protein
MKRPIFPVLVPLCLLLTAGAARADEPAAVHPQQLSARDLLQACASSALTATGRERRRYCDGFVSGVEEGIRLGVQAPGMNICVPPDISSRRLSEAYIRYAADHRNDLGRPAAVVVMDALRETYSCATGS